MTILCMKNAKHRKNYDFPHYEHTVKVSITSL